MLSDQSPRAIIYRLQKSPTFVTIEEMTQNLALLISLAIEVPTVLLLAQLMEPRPDKKLLLLLICAGIATLVTHPLAWIGSQMLIPYLRFPERAGSIEIIVTIAEGAFYALVGKIGWRQGLFLSAIANATSFFGGLAIYQLL